MPHIILEHSDNIKNPEGIFNKLHQLLESQLPTQLASCKSRSIAYHSFWLGDGSPKNAFVHLKIKILAGRTDKVKENLAASILKLMRQSFEKKAELNTQLSLEILDLNQHYYKE